jgi:2-C-methyl-D-erythritol 4-phosphate cytidylyltransferase
MSSLILLLGGRGRRFGGKKQFLTFRDKPLYEIILERIKDLFEETVLVVPPEDVKAFREKYPSFKIVAGGKERQYSVYNGLKEVSTPVVAVHDGARPLASRELFEKTLKVLKESNCDGAVPVLPVRDTLKRVTYGVVEGTVPRENLFAVQTPQVFKTKVLKECHERALKENFLGTDDASLLERCNRRVCITEGEAKNIKITYPEDWEIVKCLLERENF